MVTVVCSVNYSTISMLADIVGVVKKCYWMLAMLVMTGGMTFSVYALTAAYLNYPVSVDVSVHREQQLVFPAVTICNMSPVTKSALQTADLSGTAKRRKKRTPPASGGLKHLSINQSISQSVSQIFTGRQHSLLCRALY